MIHTASLVHDDVLDDCNTRRGARPARRRLQHAAGKRRAGRAAAVRRQELSAPRPRAGKTTVNSLYGSRVAVLVGDYLFAQSSWFLANLDNLEARPRPASRAVSAPPVERAALSGGPERHR
jgi:all-trans-nonaprenyl-diphosphate synthase